MHVSLIPHWEKFVKDKVTTERYKNANEVFRETLRLLKERDEKHQAQLTSLRDDLETGRKGESISFDAESIKRQARQLRSEKA